jgi:sulfopyruvate decarboxylase subunit alpha
VGVLTVSKAAIAASAPTAADVCDALHRAGVSVVTSLPDNWLVGLIEEVKADSRFVHIPVTREESAIAICAGAFLGGKTGAAIMGTSGFMTCVYAITKICMSYEIGMPIVMNLRGGIHDEAAHHYGNALYAQQVLDTLKIPVVRVDRSEDLVEVPSAVQHARLIKRPVAIVVGKPSRSGGQA